METHTEFQKFIIDILSFRCLLPDKIIKEYFDNEKSWFILHRAFRDKALGPDNYEISEFAGDRVLNLATVEWILEAYPLVVNIGFLDKFKSNSISKDTLSYIGIKHGFTNSCRF